MEGYSPNDPWKAREYEIDVKRWVEIDGEASKAMKTKQYHYARLWYEKILKEAETRLGRDDPNLLWLKRHYSEALMKEGSFEQADKLHEELLKIVPPVAPDTDGIIEDILFLRSARAEQLLQGKTIPDAKKAITILEVAQAKSRKVLGKKHETTLAIGASLERSENFKLQLKRRERKNKLARQDAEDKLLDDTGTLGSTSSSESLSEKQVVKTPQSPQVVDRAIPTRQTQQRPLSSEASHSEISTLSDAQLLGGTTDEHKITDKWFSVWLSKTHALLDSASVGKPRVRIAILDTGLNKHHPQVKSILEKTQSERRIKKCKSWVPGAAGSKDTDENGMLLSDEDTDGHGTHCAMVAHKVAPNADIYVARIFKDRNSVRGEYVVEAINHAIEKWDIDIISMSFALSEDDPQGTREIWNAIDAVRYKVLMFAAASNDGLNSGRKFPARHPDVFCIHSASGAGNPSRHLNPGPWRDDFNYTALGEYVEAPSCGETTPRVSGTSIAAPIAAGIAALVLEFTRQYPTEHQREIRNVEKLKTKAGMDKIFSKMVDPNPSTKSTEDYVNIQPWQWLVHDVLEDPNGERARESIANDIDRLIYRVHHPGPEVASEVPKKV